MCSLKWLHNEPESKSLLPLKKCKRRQDMVGRIIIPHLNLWNQWIHYCIWQTALCKCDYVKDNEMGRLSWIIWAGPMESQGSFWKGGKRVKSQMWWQKQRSEQCGISQWMQATSRTRKRREMGFLYFLRGFRIVLPGRWFKPSETDFGPLSDLRNYKIINLR